MSKTSYMTESLVRDMVLRRMREKGLTMREAMDQVYNSRTFEALSKESTGLFFQSSTYLYDMLSEEIDLDQPVNYAVMKGIGKERRHG